MNPSLCRGGGGIGASNQELFAQNANGLVMQSVSHPLLAKGNLCFQGDKDTLVFDARGNGDGVTCPTVTGDHAGRPTDYTPVVCSQVAPTLDCSYATKQGLDNQHIDGGAGLFVQTAIAFERRFVRTTGGQPSRDINPCLRADVNAGDGAPCVATVAPVRRLTPIEAERLMGFQDDWTRIPWRGKPAEDCPDGPRYKACGNSMGVNVMRWIGTRIQEVEEQK